jgi:hypothetical protein
MKIKNPNAEKQTSEGKTCLNEKNDSQEEGYETTKDFGGFDRS